MALIITLSNVGSVMREGKEETTPSDFEGGALSDTAPAGCGSGWGPGSKTALGRSEKRAF